MGIATSATEATAAAASAVKQAATEVTHELKAQSEEVYETAKTRAEQFASERRDTAAAYARDVSDAFGSACSTLEERGRSGAAHLARKAAEQLHDFSERVQGQDIGHILRNAETFARQRPVVFLGAAFLAGFGLIRLLGRGGAEQLAAQAKTAVGEVTDKAKAAVEELGQAYQ